LGRRGKPTNRRRTEEKKKGTAKIKVHPANKDMQVLAFMHSSRKDVGC